jgi:cell division protein FtsZ
MATGNNDYSFTMVEETSTARLVVLGVGGMGNNAMENLARAGVSGLELYSLNTDVQALRRCNGSKPVQLGGKRTGGKGAGGNSDIGRMSAEDDSEKIRKIVEGAELVFVASGMGGGTGSGAAPIVARICRELGVLCVCIVTMPMECEGQRRGEKGRAGLVELRKNVDSLLIIENEKLSDVMDQEDISIIEVFRKADKIVVDIVSAITRIINSHGYINLDLADLKNVLQRNDGSCVDAYIGMGEATGPDRARKASEIALHNPLLRTINIEGAANLLVNVAGSEQIGHKEAMIAVKNIAERVGADNQEIYMGVVTDNSMADRISVTVIATGLPSRSGAVVKMKAPHDLKNKGISNQSPEETVRGELLIDSSNVPAKVEAVQGLNYSPAVSGFSPLIRKEEWQTPAYIRNQAKSSDLAAVPEVRVSRIDQQSNHLDNNSVHVAVEGHQRRPLYRMAG